MKKKMDTFNFNKLLQSMTIAQIKDVIFDFNENYLPNNALTKEIKGFSSLKKEDLKKKVILSIPEKIQNELFKKFSPIFIQNLISKALKLISGEHKTEKILNAGITSGGKGYQVWFKGKAWSHKSSINLNNKESMRNSCNCRYGRENGICIHEMAIYLLLLSKKMIEIDDIPLEINKKLYQKTQKRLDMIAAQSLFKEEPAIMLEEDYYIFINGDFITLEGGGKFPGKQTKDMSQEEDDINTFLTRKVVDLMLRKIKVKKKEGKVIKILIDSYGIIDEIIENPRLVSKIIKKLLVLDDPLLPKDEEQLEAYLKSDLKENIEEITLQPPFEAYMGKDPYIFVSYTHKDKSDVYPILKKINNEGIKIWYDEGIALSEEWDKFIIEKLNGCKIFLSFVSPFVLESQMTQKEIYTALGENKIIFSIYLKKTKLSGGLKMIRNVQGLQKYDMSEERFYTKLIKEIRRILNE